MASESVTTVGDVAQFRNSLRKPVAAADRKPGPYPYYGAAAIQDWVDGYLFDGLHVLVGEDGTVQTADGSPVVRLVDGKFWVNNHAHVIRCDNNADTRFLAYALSQVSIAPFVTGAAQPKLNMGNLRRVAISWLNEADRHGIADVGEAIDRRIQNLAQANVTLDAIAQALFKSWFVDFDPVRAKAEGREPEGMDAATAALFPSEFEDSELGPIPKGWRTESFDQEFDFTMGQSPPGSSYNQDGVGVPFFQGSTDFGDVFPAERVFCTEPTRFAQAGDLLMSVRAPVGALNIANVDCSIGRGLCAIRHKSGSTGFTQQSVQACLVRIENAAGEGALFKSLSKKQLADLPVVVADGPVVDAMVSLLEPLAARRIAGARQAQRLAELRDTLLPRLISGKLRLPDAKREIQDAAT